MNTTRNILNEEDLDEAFDGIVNDKFLGKSDTEVETYESIEKLK